MIRGLLAALVGVVTLVVGRLLRASGSLPLQEVGQVLVYAGLVIAVIGVGQVLMRYSASRD